MKGERSLRVVSFNVATLGSVCRHFNAMVDRNDTLHLTLVVDITDVNLDSPWRVIFFFDSPYYRDVTTVGVIIPIYKRDEYIPGDFAIGKYSVTDNYLVAELEQQSYLKYNESKFYAEFEYIDLILSSYQLPAPVIYSKEIQLLYVNDASVHHNTEMIYVDVWRITTITYCVFNLDSHVIHMSLDRIDYYSDSSCSSVHFKADEKFSGMNLFVKAEEVSGGCERLILHDYILSIDPDSEKYLPSKGVSELDNILEFQGILGDHEETKPNISSSSSETDSHDFGFLRALGLLEETTTRSHAVTLHLVYRELATFLTLCIWTNHHSRF
ncbi:hypothetical protein Btru_050829 [Bulinus truncatus]|nr:hypothetical protein Btru_050829 [Bulinus truncatus]